MEQNTENSGSGSRRGQTSFYVALGLLVVIAVVYFATRNKGGENNQNTNQDVSSTQNQNGSDQFDSGQITGDQTSNSSDSEQSSSGNVSATGTLQVSDNASRGNYMVASNRGNIYIQTARDYSSTVGQQVTLNASGTIQKFTFLGFAGVNADLAVDTTARGGAAEDNASTVSFKGTLNKTDDTSFGNYVITSGSGKVYLKTVHDYSSKIGSEVTLTATGTLQSFTNAVLN